MLNNIPSQSKPAGDERAWSGFSATLVLAVAIVFGANACISYSNHSYSTHTKTTTSATPPPPSASGLSLRRSTVALFVGVSNYDDRARVLSTPTHTLSAAQVRSSLYEAAKISGLHSLQKSLGLAARCCFRGRGGSVDAAVFTSDGSKVVTGSADGTISIWPADGQGEAVVLKPNTGVTSTAESPASGTKTGGFSHSYAVTALAVSRDGSLIVAGAADGTASVWRASQANSPIPLADGCAVKSVAFNSDGSRILTTCADGVARLFTLDGNRALIRFPVEAGCAASGKAAFSPSDDRIVVVGCNQIRVWAAEGSGEANLIGTDSGVIHTVAFSPDGSLILTAGQNGVRLWSSGGTRDLTVAETAKLEPTKAMFSADGSSIAALYTDGTIRVWKADFTKPPTKILTLGTNGDSLELSPDGQYVLVTHPDGGAWIAQVGVHIPSVNVARLRSDDGLREQPALRTASFSPDGKRVAAGYADGSVAVLPGVDTVEFWNSFRKRFTILADLRMNPQDADTDFVVSYLTQLQGTSDLVHRHKEWKTPGIDDDMFSDRRKQALREPPLNYFGEGKPVTKTRILAALSDTLTQASEAVSSDAALLLFIYVSAHGVTGPDGHPYLLPADANAQDPSTWISYEQFLEPIYGFMERQNQVHRDSEDTGPAAIIILDTCQDQNGLGTGVKTPRTPADLSRPGIIVVEGTAPGKYAWYWEATSETTGVATVESEHRFGFPRPPKAAPHGTVHKTETAYMSVLPVASQIALKNLIDIAKARPEGTASVISAKDWIAATGEQVRVLQEKIPEVRESGKWQEMQVQADHSQCDFALFHVEKQNP